MKKKGIWLVVSSLVVLALLAASCGGGEEKEEAAPVVKEEAAPAVKKEAAPVVKEEAAPAVKEAAPAAGAEMVKVTLTKVDGTPVEKMVEKPQYGGTFIVATGISILAWDEAIQAPWTLSDTLAPTNEDLLMGSWYRGPAGTGETAWWPADWLNVDLVGSNLAESWEFPDDVTIIYHIRKGVRWHNKPPVNGREFTADDVVFNIKRIYFDIETSTMWGMAGDSRPTDVYATDKYTVVVKAPPGQLGITWEYVSNLVKMVPPEVVAQYGDMNDWENVIGTGAFLLTDYVAMSSATWVRNPDYWEYDPVLGKDYPLPYLDGTKLLIIPDMSTRIAALRTGKVEMDNAWGFPREDALQLIKTNPEILYKKMEPFICFPLGFRIDKPELPFDDIRVRRALLMGVDNQEITDTFFGGDAAVLNYKVPPMPGYVEEGWYTPLADLPESTRELYEYHPDKAKQLLAEAGYPDGFKVKVIMYDMGFIYPLIDIATIAKEYWAKIGVDISLDIKEAGTFYSIYQRKTHEEALWCGRGWNVPAMYLVRKDNMYNWAMVDDPKIDDGYYPQVSDAYFDREKKNKLMREMNQYVLSQAFYYTPPSPYLYAFRQPWLKNHYMYITGTGPYSTAETYKYYWIDQELKKEMGH